MSQELETVEGTKHTPGPWAFDDDGDVYSTRFEDCRGGGNLICLAPEGWEDSMSYWPANARLIAAAPDMIHALQLADAALSGANMNMKVIETKVRAAIAKALGKPATDAPRDKIPTDDEMPEQFGGTGDPYGNHP